MRSAITPYRKKRYASKSLGKSRRRLKFTDVVPTRSISLRGGATGFPNKMRTKLIYQEDIILDASAGGVVAKNQFTLNGLYDPNITGTGHQPLGFDNFMAVYSKYTVISATITVAAINYVTATDPVVVGVVIADGGQTIPTNTNTLMELGPQMSYTTFIAGSLIAECKNPEVKRKAWIHKELMRAYGDDTTNGDAGANPTQQLYATVFVGSTTSTNIGAIELLVRIEYDAEFHNPNVNQSAN